ncbi:MAG TPA: hypothetical protein VMW91_07240 [Desulfosporosinus sp.]|nr:hypothetical protein [Desulfosporosinus sp.]
MIHGQSLKRISRPIINFIVYRCECKKCNHSITRTRMHNRQWKQAWQRLNKKERKTAQQEIDSYLYEKLGPLYFE